MMREGKLFSNTLLLGVSAAAGKILSFLLLPLFTSLLSPAEFGVCEIFLSTSLLLIPLFSLYAPQATFRFFAGGERGSVRAGTVLLCVGAFLFLVTMPLWGSFPALQSYRILLLCFVFASLWRSFLAHVLRASGNFRLFALQQLFCSLLTAALQLHFLYTWHLGVRGYLLGIILGDAITAIFLFFSCLPYYARKKSHKRGLYIRMLRFSLPLVPASILWWGMSFADRYILLHFHGEHATGIYAAAARFPALVSFAAGIFLEAWHYAALQGEQDAQTARFGRMYALMLPAFFALGGGAVAFSPLLASFFLSHTYADAAKILAFLLFGAICAGMASFLDSAYTLQLRTTASLYTSILATAVHLVLSFLLIPRFAAVGAALASALGFFTLFLVRLLHIARFLIFPRYARSLFSSLFLLFGAGLFLAQERVFLGVITALLSFLPLWELLIESLAFLWTRLGVFWANMRKKEKYIEKDRKI